MLDIVLNNLKKSESQKLTGSNLPYFEHKCALLNLPSYDTTIGFSFKIKREFKRIKRYSVASLDFTECQSKSTMQKLHKIALLNFGFAVLLRASKQVFKYFLNYEFLSRLQSIINKLAEFRYREEWTGTSSLPIISLQVNICGE